MVTMSSVWEQAVEVLRGRAGILARIAVPTLVVPALIRDGWTALNSAPGTVVTVATGMVGVLLTIAALLATFWGQIAITAVATDPATTAADASAHATRRFGPAVGVYAAALLVAVVLMIPVGVALAGAPLNLAAISRGVAPNIAPGRASFILVWFLVLLAIAIVATARLFLLTPVITNERQGLRAFARSWSLTRGMAWRIIGVVLLFALVWLLVQSAAALIVGIVVRLAAGAGPSVAVALAVAAVNAVVTCTYVVVAAVFATQLYVAVSGRAAEDVFA